MKGGDISERQAAKREKLRAEEGGDTPPVRVEAGLFILRLGKEARSQHLQLLRLKASVERSALTGARRALFAHWSIWILLLFPVVYRGFYRSWEPVEREKEVVCKKKKGRRNNKER